MPQETTTETSLSTAPPAFQYLELGSGEELELGDNDYNHLLFLLEGSISISCNEFSKRMVSEKEIILVPIAANMNCMTMSHCQILVFTFDLFPDYFDRSYMRSLIDICNKTTYQFLPFPINESLNDFFSLLLLYIEHDLGPLMHTIKGRELFILMCSVYSRKEIAELFYPLIGYSSDFRTKVLRNYRKVSNIEDLAELFGAEKRTFTRRFKEEFGDSPYQWLLNQKAKHVRFSLVDTNHSLDEIRKEYGFKFPAHFTRFCWEQFSSSPMKLRKRQSRDR